MYEYKKYILNFNLILISQNQITVRVSGLSCACVVVFIRVYRGRGWKVAWCLGLGLVMGLCCLCGKGFGGIGCIGAWACCKYYMRNSSMSMPKQACRSWHGVESGVGVGAWGGQRVESGYGKGKAGRWRSTAVEGCELF